MFTSIRGVPLTWWCCGNMACLLLFARHAQTRHAERRPPAGFKWVPALLVQFLRRASFVAPMARCRTPSPAPRKTCQNCSQKSRTSQRKKKSLFYCSWWRTQGFEPCCWAHKRPFCGEKLPLSKGERMGKRVKQGSEQKKAGIEIQFSM